MFKDKTNKHHTGGKRSKKGNQEIGNDAHENTTWMNSSFIYVDDGIWPL